MKRAIVGGLAVVLSLWGGWYAVHPGALAQFAVEPVRPESADDPAGRRGPSIDNNSELTRDFGKAKEVLAGGNFRDAIRFFQEGILDRSEDYFTDQTMRTSLKRETLEIIEQLPPDARRHYELVYGRMAEQLLAEARDTRNPRLLEEVVRRYFHTPAGYEAAYLLGTYHLDRSNPLAAALQFEQVRRRPKVARGHEPALSLKTALSWARAGFSDRCEQVLLELKSGSTPARIVLKGREVPLFGPDEDPVEWLVALFGEPQHKFAPGEAQWTLFRGSPAGTGVSAPASPVWDGQWRRSTLLAEEDQDDREWLEKLAAELKELETDQRAGSILTLPAAHPLIVADTVLYRTLGHLRAVSLTTGKLLWYTDVHPDNAYEFVLRNDQPTLHRPVNRAIILPGGSAAQATPRKAFLMQRAWRDLTAGTLSSDGRQVYVLDGLGFIHPQTLSLRVTNNHPLAAADYNNLKAFDVATGQCRWEVGGPRGDELGGTFFLGPPLPLEGKLYCLVENSGEIRLLVLDADTGELEWAQTLVLPEAALQIDVRRRMAGLTPAFADGILVCPTAAGAVVAIDVARRVVLWGQRYEARTPPVPRDRAAAMRMRFMGHAALNMSDDEGRWLDSVPTIVGGRVLLTSRDSDELVCLKIEDGSVEWTRPRGQGLYVAGVHDGRAIIVGQTQVDAVRLADGGHDAWKEPTPIPAPSGRGFQTGRLYHLPLSTAEVATLDLETGRILARSPSRDEQVAGNLVSAGGAIVSQSIDSLAAFKPRGMLEKQIEEELRQLPDDPEAVALRGEMRLHRGDEKLGLADLRRALELRPDDPRSTAVLLAALMEGLRFDFAAHRSAIDEIEHLVQDPQQRARYLRLIAAGLEQIGDHSAAFSEFLKLADTGEPQMVRLSGLLSVRSDRWVRPRIADLYRQAPQDERPAMDRAIAAVLETAREADDPQKLRQFLNSFSGLSIADEARRSLLEQLDRGDQTLEHELLLQRLRQSEHRPFAVLATARLVPLYVGLDRPDLAKPLVEELSKKWADDVCLDGKTGRELADEWLGNEEFAARLQEPGAWPDRRLEAERSDGRVSRERIFAVEFVGPRGPWAHWSLGLDQQRQTLIARDGQGQERWRFSLAELGDLRHRNNPRHRTAANIYGNTVHVHGHLMVVVLGNFFVVLDVLDAVPSPRLLWFRELYEASSVQANASAVQMRQVNLAGGGRRVTFTDALQRPMGTVGPINDEAVVYQVGTSLFAADPLTGDLLWERRNVVRGSELFGDGQFVIVVPPGSNRALVLRAVDGEEVAHQSLPRQESRFSTQGRRVISWQPAEGNGLLACTDAVTGETLWQRPFHRDAHLAEIQADEMAVLEPGGRFVVLSLDDGDSRLDQTIELDQTPEQIAVFRSPERYLLLTRLTEQGANNVRVMGPAFNSMQVHGPVCGFDRATGRLLWQTQVERQSIDLMQPDNLPVLIFTARTYTMFRQGQPFSQYQNALLILDVRNGQMVFEHRGNEQVQQFHVSVDAHEKKIDIDFYSSTVTIHTTDKPLADADAEQP